MEDKRIYVLVPETVQVEVPSRWGYGEGTTETKSYPMVARRLISQGVHIGRMLGNWSFNRGNPEITTITLSVRNTKELRKVSDEVQAILRHAEEHIAYEEFHDTNIGFYETTEKVHTITSFGPVTREEVESAIGHLELYK
jgi:hypothetical protein